MNFPLIFGKNRFWRLVQWKAYFFLAFYAKILKTKSCSDILRQNTTFWVFLFSKRVNLGAWRVNANSFLEARVVTQPKSKHEKLKKMCFTDIDLSYQDSQNFWNFDLKFWNEPQNTENSCKISVTTWDRNRKSSNNDWDCYELFFFVFCKIVLCGFSKWC